MMTLEAIKWSRGKLEILDQLLLPAVSKYIEINNVEDGWTAIKTMQVRGAPAIAILGCLSLATEIYHNNYKDKDALYQTIVGKLQYLVSARPTAVNIKLAALDLSQYACILKNQDISLDSMKTHFIEKVEEMLSNDVADNRAIGDNGAKEILQNANNEAVTVLTHCNTGSLATAGYGTALGVIRSLHSSGKLEHVYCTETRPYNQGARLTAYELVYENMPGTLICDSMVGSLMKSKKISAVVTGADRVVRNGDTANKIGTYQIAVLAKHHNVPFYIAAPSTTVDLSILSGDEITIEERPSIEMTNVFGQRIAADRINCWNPAFDVTPADLITGIITERGVFTPDSLADSITTDKAN